MSKNRGGEMKEIAWIKTILTAYRHLELIARTIDEMAQEEVKKSFVALYHTTMDSVDRLIELNERKRKLINLKVITEQAICQLKKVTDQKIIALCYIDGLKSAEVISLLHMSTRTYFRRKNIAMMEMMTILKNAGYTLEWWLKEYGSEKWLVEQFYLTVEKEIEFDNFEQYKFIKNLKKELNSI